MLCSIKSLSLNISDVKPPHWLPSTVAFLTGRVGQFNKINGLTHTASQEGIYAVKFCSHRKQMWPNFDFFFVFVCLPICNTYQLFDIGMKDQFAMFSWWTTRSTCMVSCDSSGNVENVLHYLSDLLSVYGLLFSSFRFLNFVFSTYAKPNLKHTKYKVALPKKKSFNDLSII